MVFKIVIIRRQIEYLTKSFELFTFLFIILFMKIDINVFLKKVSKQMNILTKKDLYHLSEIQSLCNVITHLIRF